MKPRLPIGRRQSIILYHTPDFSKLLSVFCLKAGVQNPPVRPLAQNEAASARLSLAEAVRFERPPS